MDPIEEARHAALKIETAREDMAEARRERQAAVRAARATTSAPEIAEQLGISTARVYRILSGKET